MLKAKALVAGYGQREVLHGIDLAAERGEIVAVVGHNGAGKSTFFRVVFGLLAPTSGEVLIAGVDSSGRTPRDLVRSGVGLVEQGQKIFPDLTVLENLEVRSAHGAIAGFKEQLAIVQELFPTLEQKLERPARTLSGGEKQMLSVASALMPQPRLLLLDEPTLGLAPILVDGLLGSIRDACRKMRITAIVVEHRIAAVLSMSDRFYVFRDGRVVAADDSSQVEPEEVLAMSCFSGAGLQQ